MPDACVRYRIRRHCLYKSGESEIVRLCKDQHTQKRLINQWLSFCIWSITKDLGSLETINSVTREHIISYGQYLKSEFDNGKFASTNTVSSYLSGMDTVMKLIHGDNWEKISSLKDCGLEPISHIPNKKPKLDKNNFPDIESLAGYLLDLQMSLGVTVREALILDLKAALIEGRTTGFITMTNSQNGTRRTVPQSSFGHQSHWQWHSSQTLAKTIVQKMGI